jgi:hypothetical protein
MEVNRSGHAMSKTCTVCYRQGTGSVNVFVLSCVFRNLSTDRSLVQVKKKKKKKKTPWPQSASELYRPSERRLSAKLVPTFCGSRYYFFQVAPQLH